jgi:transposase
VIDVDEKELIRRAHFLQGLSMRRIARERRHSRHTVRRALEDPGPPVYRRRQPKPRPVLGPYAAVIDQWLVEDQQRPPKQRHTARRIYNRLVAEYGFRGGESTVRQYVRERRPNRPEVVIPLEHDPSEAQVDWGVAQVIMAGRQTSVRLFCFRLCYSQKPFVMAFPTERREAFFAGHVTAFSFIGGVPRRITYDNLPTAVQRILKGGRREEQREFIAFRSHYLFESNFCRPGREGAHEKGLVENLVGFGRRNFLVPLPEVDSFEELNALLLARCQASDGRLLADQGRTVREAWEAEQPHLLPLPRFAWPCCTVHVLKSSRSSVVRFEGNRYSVPAGYAGRNVLLRAYVDRVDIAHGERIIASHPRSYNRGQDILDPYHYVPVLQVKPGAFHHAKAVRRYPWPPVFRRALAFLEERHPDGQGVREFLRILALKEEAGEESLGQALELALRYRCLAADAVRHLLHQLEAPEQEPPRLDLCTLRVVAPTVPVRDVTLYNQLLGQVP